MNIKLNRLPLYEKYYKYVLLSLPKGPYKKKLTGNITFIIGVGADVGIEFRDKSTKRIFRISITFFNEPVAHTFHSGSLRKFVKPTNYKEIHYVFVLLHRLIKSGNIK